MTPYEIAEHVKRRRYELAISLRELAEATGVDRRTLARLEDGDGNVRKSTVALVLATLDKLSMPKVDEETRHMLAEIEREVMDAPPEDD